MLRDAVLRREDHARSANEQPDARLHHRPQRPRRPALRRGVRPGRDPAGDSRNRQILEPICATFCAGHPAASSSPRCRSSRPSEDGDRQSRADRPSQRRRDRRRGAPLAVRLCETRQGWSAEGGACEAPARCAAGRDLPRLHRHADRVRPTSRPARSSATTSTSTTSPGRSRMARPSGSTTSRGWPRSS